MTLGPVRIETLDRCPETIPVLAAWFREEWADYFSCRSQENIEGDFQAAVADDGLPVIWVAFEGDEPVGTVALRSSALDSLDEHEPGVGGLYVIPSRRKSGIARTLVEMAETEARRRGFPHLHAATASAVVVFERIGWEVEGNVHHDGAEITLLRRNL